MSDHPTRREVLAQTIPALAMGSALLGTAGAFAQDAPAAPAAAEQGAILQLLGAAHTDDVYTLPPLPYAPDALEPHIDAQTMSLHHDKHHAAYVANANKAIESLAKLRDDADIDPARLAGLTRDLSFNTGGHLLHTIFWGTLGKPAEVEIERQVKLDIVKQYGSLEKFQNHFTKVATGVKGSGWAVAFYAPVDDRILITEVGDQDSRLIPTAIPLLPLDVWEHAYYLKYQNNRAAYVKAWWNVVNWAEVDSFYKALRKMYGHEIR